MGNQPSKKAHTESRSDSLETRSIEQKVKQSTPEMQWQESKKSIEDLLRLMRDDGEWQRIVRPFMGRLVGKQEYQRYLRAILGEILERQCEAVREDSGNELSHENGQSEQQQSQSPLFNQQKPIPRPNSLPSCPSQQLSSLFTLYKTRLQQSYFVITHQKGGIKQNTDQIEFEVSLKQLQTFSSLNPTNINSYDFSSLIPELMLSQLYQYSSIQQKYLNELFVELNLKAYEALERFVYLLVEEFVIVEDQFNLTKFVVEYEVMMKSLGYLEMCAKIMTQRDRKEMYKKIQQLKANPTQPYTSMCRIFLKYKSAQSASLIMHTLIQKGYHLDEPQLKLFFYLQVYHIFLYTINYTMQQYKDYLDGRKKHQDHSKHVHSLSGSFLSFNDQFQKLQIEEILEMFLSVRSYAEIEKIRKCFSTAYGLYDPQRGEYLFLQHLKKYALMTNRSHFIITIEALKNHLSSLQQEQKEDIELLFLHRIAHELSNEIPEYERHVIDLTKMYNFSEEGYEFVKILFKVSAILSKFQISVKVRELCQFLFFNRRLMGKFMRFRDRILNDQPSDSVYSSPSHQPTSQQLQFQALIITKKVITKFFTLGQSSTEQVVFIIEDKFSSECFEYSTREIESLFILTEYLHKNLFETFIPLQQLHQLLFQHMLYFYKYDHVETMLKEENLERYGIQKEVVRMLVLENVREMLVKGEKAIGVVSQDVKRQLRIVEEQGTGRKEQQQKKKVNPLLEPEGHVDGLETSTIHYQQQNDLDLSQVQQLQSIKALFKIMVKLEFYSISLNQEQKENININLLYFLIEHYEHQIEVFDYDQLYKLIVLIEGKHQEIIQQNLRKLCTDSQSLTKSETPVTNEYLKFKIDLAQLSYEKGKIKFGENTLKQVLQYEPPWISSEIIKIIQKSPHSAAINHSFLNIAFQYCVKGEDLMFLLGVWKQKMTERQKKTGQKLTQLFEPTKKYIIVDDSYVKDEKEYRNLVAEMIFNDETLKSKDYELFFTLLGTQPDRAFYLIYSKGLDIVKIEIILKQGMKLGIFNTLNVTNMFFKLLYFIVSNDKSKHDSHQKKHEHHIKGKTSKISYIKFRNVSIEEVVRSLQVEKLLEVDEKSKHPYQKEIPFILLKKMYKSVKSLLLLPAPFIRNYLQNPSSTTTHSQTEDNPFLYMFLFDQNHRQKHLIALKDEPMGKSDINVYKQLCAINGLNIIDLIIFNLTNQLNTVDAKVSQRMLEEEGVQNVLQKLVTWTENEEGLLGEIVAKLTTRVFSSQTLYNLLAYLRERENPLVRQMVTDEHMQVLQSLKQIELHTELHGIITEQFLTKPISYSPKQKLSEKHIKILKKELKLRNVFLISKIMYFCYGMSTQVEKQVLKLFIKENENEQEKEIFEQIKQKLQEAGERGDS